MFAEDTQLRNRQEIAYNMLIEFTRICEKLGLRYFAICGTCLGAIRHNGFIPWDDDVDVTMPYDDYCKFRELAPKELNEPYAIYDQHKNRHAIHIFMKIHDESTAYVPNRFAGFYDRYVGFSMDIMPLYGTPNDDKLRRTIEKHTISYLKLNRLQRMPFTFENSFRGRVAWLLNSPRRLIYSYDYFGEKAEKEFSKFPYDDSEMVLFGWRFDVGKILFHKEDFDHAIKVPFEDILINVPCGYDRYLKQEYGDYMQFPPEDKRIPKHVPGIIDYKKSYKAYLPEWYYRS